MIEQIGEDISELLKMNESWKSPLSGSHFNANLEIYEIDRFERSIKLGCEGKVIVTFGKPCLD